MRAMRAVLIVGIALAVGAACAQDSKEIVIGGQIVARVRDKGPFENLAARAAHVDKCINDIISYEDTQAPKVSLRRKGGIWHVYVGDRPCIGVYAGDAGGQNIDAKGLAQIWLKQVKAALPRATPVSQLPPAPPGPPVEESGAVTPAVPTVPGEDEEPTGITPAEPPTGGETEPATGSALPAPGASTTPTGDTVPEEEEDPLPEPAATPRSAGLLLLLDAFNSVRALSEDEYLAGRDRLAVNLLANMEPFMSEARTEGVASGTPQPPRPPIELVTPKPIEEATTPAEPPLTPGGETTSTGTSLPIVPTVPTVPTTDTEEVTPPPSVPEGVDPSMARVPQKKRIKRKFAAAQQPFQALREAGDPKADEVAQLLKESRTAHTAGDFDTSEAKVDAALTLMGVPIPK